MRKKGLGSTALARICGVSARTVRNWLAHDPPVPSVRRGRRHTFDPVQVRSWLTAHDKREPLSRISAYLASLEPDSRPDKSAEDARAEAYARQLKRKNAAAARAAKQEAHEIEADRASRTTWNIFKVRDTTAKLYAEAVRMYIKAPTAEKLAHQRNVNTAADTLRKLELDCISVAREMGAVITVADAARVIGAISATVKRRMLALPESVAADLAALDTEAEVSAFLADRITEALRELADAIPKLTRSDRQQPEPAPEDPDAD
jgi:DNA-binding transcriptional MerR regulator